MKVRGRVENFAPPNVFQKNHKMRQLEIGSTNCSFCIISLLTEDYLVMQKVWIPITVSVKTLLHTGAKVNFLSKIY